MKKVVVGMSGGVDSSVAAILLKEQGYEVVGVTFIFTDDFKIDDAKSVCDKLGIQHYVKDYRLDFKEKIIEQFILDYKNGLTPNPCVLCNKTVKIKYLFDFMEEINADYIATGHYAKIINNNLFKSKNINKDQTYFLSHLSKKQLSKILFPLDSLDKAEVRKIASKNNLLNANKKDSFDVCFITTNFKDYISNTIKACKGPIVNIKTNMEVGEHNGLMYYTIGQRKGLNLGGNSERLFVVGKNMEKNILYVCDGDENEYLYSTSCLVEAVNWIGDEKVDKCMAKFRYRQQDNSVKLKFLDNEYIYVEYEQGIKAVTPGQTCVFYDGEQCLGGGIIKEVRKNNKKLWYL